MRYGCGLQSVEKFTNTFLKLEFITSKKLPKEFVKESQSKAGMSMDTWSFLASAQITGMKTASNSSLTLGTRETTSTAKKVSTVDPGQITTESVTSPAWCGNLPDFWGLG